MDGRAKLSGKIAWFLWTSLLCLGARRVWLLMLGRCRDAVTDCHTIRVETYKLSSTGFERYTSTAVAPWWHGRSTGQSYTVHYTQQDGVSTRPALVFTVVLVRTVTRCYAQGRLPATCAVLCRTAVVCSSTHAAAPPATIIC